MDKLPLSMARSLGLIVYKYPERSVKRTLERELSVPESADCDFDGRLYQRRIVDMLKLYQLL